MHSNDKNHKILATTAWPKYDLELVKDDSYTIAIQVNGKLRDTYEFFNDVEESYIKEIACNLSTVQKHTANKTIAKIIIVPKKIINIVVVD